MSCRGGAAAAGRVDELLWPRQAVSSSAELVLQGEEEGGRHDGGGKAPIGGQLRRMTLLEKICTQVLRRLTLRKRVLH